MASTSEAGKLIACDGALIPFGERRNARNLQVYAVREEKGAERGLIFSGWWKGSTVLAIVASST